MAEEKYELVKFVDNGFELEVKVSPNEETVWLTKSEMAFLFERDRSVISKHIRNIFLENECVEKRNVHSLHIPGSDKPVEVFSLDVIISVGYRVKSKTATHFRQWATKILRNYMIEGYAINEK